MNKKMGRPISNDPKKNIVGCKLSDEELKRLTVHCNLNNISKSDALRNGISDIISDDSKMMDYYLKSAIYGLAVGDAIGVPYEFKVRGTFDATDMIGYGTHNQPEGTWSDDTSMALATCYSIKINNNKIDYNDIRDQFENWLFRGDFTPFGNVFDCGNTCSSAIYDHRGCSDVWSNGNGSLMRIIPVAFVDSITDEQVEQVSAITHAHEISKLGCVIYINIAKKLIKGVDLEQAINDTVPVDSIYKRLINIKNLNVNKIKSTGYIVDTFEAAIWSLLTTNSYEECILKAVNLGDDTDTTAAIAGGLAGILYGYENIPKKWIEKLQGKDVIDRCLFTIN